MNDDDRTREPAWITRLARTGAAAEAKRRERQRRLGTHGAANAGRSLTAWTCICGWSGLAKELKLAPKTGTLVCPQCGGPDGLKAS